MPLRWTRQGPYLLVTSAIVASLGIALGSWMALATVLPLLAFLLLGLAAASLAGSPHPSLAHRLPGGGARLREPFVVGLVAEVAPGDAGLYEFHDRLPDVVELVEGRNAFLAPLGPGRGEFPYRVRSHARGRLRLGPITFRRWDPWHFFAFEGSIDPGDSLVVEVDAEPLGRLGIPRRRHRLRLGPEPAPSPAVGTEFFALRSYVPLDDHRRINWKASARWDELFSNEYETERSFDLALLVDLRESAAVGATGEDTTAAIQAAAAALLERALADHARVALLVLHRGVRYVPLGSGRRRRGELLDELLSPTPSGPGLASIPTLVAATLPRSTTIVALSTLVDDELARILMHLARYGHDLTIISPEPADYMDRPLWALERLTAGILLLRRRVRMEELARSARVLPWHRGVSLATLLERPRGGG